MPKMYVFYLNWLQYMVFIFLLFMLEAGMTADIFLNRDWEEVYIEKQCSYFWLMGK